MSHQCLRLRESKDLHWESCPSPEHLNKKVAIKCKAVQTHLELTSIICSQISKAFVQVTYLLFASSVIGTSMVFWVLANSEGGFISGYNKITLKLNKKSNSESVVRNREQKKKNLERRIPSNLLFKSRIKRQKALLQREDAKHLEMLYLFWAECKLSSSLPSLLITSDIEFSKYSLLIIDGFFFYIPEIKDCQGLFESSSKKSLEFPFISRMWVLDTLAGSLDAQMLLLERSQHIPYIFPDLYLWSFVDI